MTDYPSLQCFYSVLGVQKDSSSTEIRTAYRKLAMKWHPDRCYRKKAEAQDQAKQNFQKVQEAYAVLSDDAQRLLYDAGVYGVAEQDFSNEDLVREFEELQKLFMTAVDTGSSCKRGSQALNMPGCTESNRFPNKKAQSPRPSSGSCSGTTTNFSCKSATAGRQQSADVTFTYDSAKPHASLYKESFCGKYDFPSTSFNTFDHKFTGDTIPHSCQYSSPPSSRPHRKIYTQEYSQECYIKFMRDDLFNLNDRAQPMTQFSSPPAATVVSSSCTFQSQAATLNSEGFCIGAGGNCPLAGKQSRMRRKKSMKERSTNAPERSLQPGLSL